MLWQFRFLFCHTFVARGSWQKIMYLSHLIVKFHPIHSHASYAAAHFKLQNNSNESNWIKSHQYGWKCRLEVKQQMACLFQLHATLNLSHDAAASLLIFLSANSFICCFICCGESNEIRVFFWNLNHENQRENIAFAQHTYSASPFHQMENWIISMLGIFFSCRKSI